MLLVFVAAQQGWTLREARAQPVEDLQLLAAHYVLEGEEVRRRSERASGVGARASGGPRQMVERINYVNPDYRPPHERK